MNKSVVIVGFNDLLNDYLEAIVSSGDIVEKVARNMPSLAYSSMRISAIERLSRLVKTNSIELEPKIIDAKDMKSPIKEHVFFGFAGPLIKKANETLIRDKGAFSHYSIIHPTAIISDSAILSPGISILAGSIIASGCKIGEFCRINKGVVIGHDSEIESYCTIQPAVKIAGHCLIGSESYIGIGSTLIEDIRIGRGAIVAAGSVVIKDVPDGTMYAGVPAVFKKNL
jgi:sugar O-acyltransferase (sialic acid O-acetyltransferase NeuD family)